MLKIDFVALDYRKKAHYGAVAFIEERNGTNLHTPESAKTLLAQSHIRAFAGVNADGNPVAYAVWERRHHDIELRALVVLPNGRRRGLGTQMMEHLIGQLDHQRSVLRVS